MSLHTTLTAISQDIWHIQKPFKIMGIAASSRMTVVRLPDGGLWLHSPVKLDAALQAALDALGPVRYVVSPNLSHHLFVADYLKAYPQAQLFANADLALKRPDLKASIHPLSDQWPASWQTVLQGHLLAGSPKVLEWICLHKPSKSLVVTDAVQWIGQPDWSTRIFANIVGARSLGVSRIFKSFVDDAAALSQSWQYILTWDFERVILGHDVILEPTEALDVKAQLRAALGLA